MFFIRIFVKINRISIKKIVLLNYLLLKFIFIIHLIKLFKVWKLVKVVKNSTNILRHAWKRQKQQNIKFELLKDFRSRWNYTYICLKRLLEYYSIVNEITSIKSPKEIPGIQKVQYNVLRELFLVENDWILAQALAEVMGPFYLATKCLSNRTNPTFGDVYLKFIKNF